MTHKIASWLHRSIGVVIVGGDLGAGQHVECRAARKFIKLLIVARIIRLVDIGVLCVRYASLARNIENIGVGGLRWQLLLFKRGRGVIFALEHFVIVVKVLQLGQPGALGPLNGLFCDSLLGFSLFDRS